MTTTTILKTPEADFAKPSRIEPNRITVASATAHDRAAIYRLRHEVYASELAQHATNGSGALSDALDDSNVYLVARCGNDITGFISLTPPSSPFYSVEKYFAREALPVEFNSDLYEIRLLTVVKPFRGREVATLLMYAAFRWVEAHGGRHIIAIGRREVLEMYLRSGLKRTGMVAQSGAVTYEVLHTSVDALREHMNKFHGLLERLESKTDWNLNFAFRKPAACFHGGAFFQAIGSDFSSLDRTCDIINADVLDAWFPSAPNVLEALQQYLPWLLCTSPPTACEGLVKKIATRRGVQPKNILPGAGSSDLIFRALRAWLTEKSHALILDPTYGEYAHVLESVIGCTVDRLLLSRANNYQVDLERLAAALNDHYRLIVLVNPNSPTGQHIPRRALEAFLNSVPPQTRVWIDETYIEYAGPDESLEQFAARSENVLVCKSMSKVYALSGARVAYLCASAHQLENLRAITPPWVVSLPAQLAAVRALENPEYYAARYRETGQLRTGLAEGMRSLGCDVLPGIANFLLCYLPENGPDADTVVKRCRKHGLFLRDARLMGSQLGSHALRIAVKDAETSRRMLSILATCLSGGSREG